MAEVQVDMPSFVLAKVVRDYELDGYAFFRRQGSKFTPASLACF